jgi:2',3'-cyclic-nucleotide 2'-phosphodiesterase (5'-nucleotidase family)
MHNNLVPKISFFFVALFIIIISCKSPKLVVEKIETTSTQLNKNSEEDKAFLDEINPYKQKIDKEMNNVLIISTADATKGQPESTLGNLVSDIVLVKANQYSKEKVDMCMLNNGGLRTSLPTGEILLGKVFELMPFENEIVIVTLSGKQTRKMLDYVARSGGVPLAGATAIISDSTASNIKVAGADFNEEKNYRIATSDYLAGGGDKMQFFKNPISIEPTKHKLRDALIEYMVDENTKGNKLNPQKDGRLKLQ